MTTAEFLARLRSLDVKVWVENGELCCEAPKSLLTPALRNELLNRKSEILALHDAKGGLPPVKPIFRRVSRDVDLSLSFAQQRLWFLDQLETGNPAYNIFAAFRVAGPLNVAALEQSFNDIIRRHEVLRTLFRAENGQPIQVIVPDLTLTLAMMDLRDRPEAEREADAQDLATKEVGCSFDLARGPLFKATLFQVNEEMHVLLVTMHHIVSDGWSMGIFFKELRALYGARCRGEPSQLPELHVQYVDFAVWQREWLQGRVLEEHLSYWRKQLEGVSTLELPTDRPCPAVQSYRGAHQRWMLSKEVSKGLQALSRKERVTLFMTLLAAFQTLLHRYTGQSDIAVGSPIANRTRSETEGLIGFFANTLVLRSDLSGNPTFRDLLARVREVTLAAYEHQDVPFEKLVEQLQPERNLSRTPFFRVMFAFQNNPRQKPDLPGLTVSTVQIEGQTAKFDLTLAAWNEPDGIEGSIHYNTDLFDNVTIERMADHFHELLEGIVADPNRRVADLPILSEPEKHQLLIQWNNTETAYPKDKRIHELFEQQVERSPDAIAVMFENQQLTYRELNTKTNQLAHHLRKLGVGPETRVGICMERSIEMLMGLLGILKAGGAYVPMDPSYPKERLAFLLGDAQVSVLLTVQRLVQSLPEDGAQVVCLDRDWKFVSQESEENPVSRGMAGNLAYLIYTSGSTGQPKGVMIEHKSLVNYLCWVNKCLLGDAVQSLPLVNKLTFDACLKQLFGPLLRGGHVWILSEDIVAQPAAILLSLGARTRVGLNCVLSLWKAMLDTIGSGRDMGPTECLTSLLVGGEPLTKELIGKTFSALPNLQVWNLYGPTEATANASATKIASGDEATIGRPIDNTQIYILDSHLQPVPVGVFGELCIAGAGLARGYLNRPELTAEKFTANPFSDEPGSRLYRTGDLARYLPTGNIEFLGRIDDQVKIRGFRVEPGEVETVLRQHPAVRETVVLGREDVSGDKRLVAYVVLNQDASPATANLFSFLKPKLPDFMLPSAFVFLKALPLTSSGKLDRQALPAPDQSRPDLQNAFVAPLTVNEKNIAAIWAELLKVERVGVHDNFFELGGHSLLATRVVSRVRESYRIDFPLRSLFENPTVAGVAAQIEQIQSRNAVPEEMTEMLAKLESISDDEAQRLLDSTPLSEEKI